MMVYYFSNDCPVCSSGVLAFRRCTDSEHLVIICDECGSVWTNPENVAEESAIQVTRNCFVPGINASVVMGKQGWATQAEIEKLGWSSFVAGHYEADY